MFVELLLSIVPLIPLQYNVEHLKLPCLPNNEVCMLEQSLQDPSHCLTNEETIELVEFFLCDVSNFQEETGIQLDLFNQFIESVNFSHFSEEETCLLFDCLYLIDKKLNSFPKACDWTEKAKKAVCSTASRTFSDLSYELQKLLLDKVASKGKNYLRLLPKDVNLILLPYLDFETYRKTILQKGRYELLVALFPHVQQEAKLCILLRLLKEYNFHEDARKGLKSLFPMQDQALLSDVSLRLFKSELSQLIDLLFAHLDLESKNQCIHFLADHNCDYHPPLPGRLGADHVYSVKLGDAEVYFFMDLEKYDLARTIVNEAEKNLVYSIARAEFPLPTIEVASIATEYRYPIGYDVDLAPIDIDPLGTALIDAYSNAVKSNIENRFQLTISCLSREMNLIVSHDAMRYHRDQLPLQYDYLNQAGADFPKCYLAQDLTLMDWDMPKDSFSGTLMRDGDAGDIFFMLLFPGEVTTNFTLDPPEYPADGSPPVYPGATTLPYHSPYSPIDFHGKYTSGSGKGKRISNVIRGIILDRDLKVMREKAIPLQINRARITVDNLGRKISIYPNGAQIKPISADLYQRLNLKKLTRLENGEHVELLFADLDDSFIEEEMIKSNFSLSINEYKPSFFRVIKRTAGFTKLRDLFPAEFTEDSQIILINRSSIPPTHEYTQISEDSTAYRLPWMQMYFLPPEYAMLVSGEAFHNFCLTPVEEMFFRNPAYDAESLDVELLPSDIYTVMDFIILTPKKSM